MSAFSGKYYYTVDTKGRVMVPSAFREIITANYGPKLYVTNDAFEKCLHVYPLEEWNILGEKVRMLPQMNDAVSYFMRKVIASAMEVEMDKQGRVLLPQAHRQDTGIDSEAVIVGVVNKIEVWNRATWDDFMDPSRIDAASFKKDLSDFGL
jgi:MraZ protein